MRIHRLVAVASLARAVFCATSHQIPLPAGGGLVTPTAAFCPVSPDAAQVHETHNVIFDTWFPVQLFPIPDPIRWKEITQMAQGINDSMWYSISSPPGVLYSLLANLTNPVGCLPSPLVTALKAISDPAVITFLTTPGGLGALDYLGGITVFSALLKLPKEGGAIIAQLLREAYLTTTYGYAPLADLIATIDIPDPFLSDQDMPGWLAANTPTIVNKLKYDPLIGPQVTHVDGPIDYLIVGSGPAGSTLASQLQAGGKRVVLLERGPFVVWGSMTTMSYSKLMFKDDVATTPDNGILIRSGQTVGGGTSVNIDLAFSPSMDAIRAHIDKWIADGRFAPSSYYTHDAIDAAYSRIENIIRPYQVQFSEVNPDNLKLWDGALSIGIQPSLYALNRYPLGTSPSPVDSKKDAAVRMLYEPLRNKTNPLSVVPDVLVDEVIYENGVATGVRFTQQAPWKSAGNNTLIDPYKLGIPVGTQVSVFAKNVILSAGTLGTSRVLLNTANSYPELRTPNIGHGAVIHPSFPLIGRFATPVDMLKGLDSAVYVDQGLQKHFFLEAMTGLPAYGAILISGNGMDIYNGITGYDYSAGFGVALIDESSLDNQVVVGSDGEAQLKYELTESDKVFFRNGVVAAVNAMLGSGAKEVYIPTVENIFDSSTWNPMVATPITNSKQAANASNLQFIPNQTILTAAHLQAANRIGTVAQGAVFSPRHRLWTAKGTEVKNLYGMDSSIFPSSVGANPMQSLYTFAYILAQRLLSGDLKS
ncbi:hypothetical protein BKA62DRAFT_787682 [Auriculariales sp. MPI-PUGE-AT-0066]|nr:hypothetical protein BKA62DRAFT_787682 [Auriculariales sp. MPI-PUGE-AT-0066]